MPEKLTRKEILLAEIFDGGEAFPSYRSLLRLEQPHTDRSSWYHWQGEPELCWTSIQEPVTLKRLESNAVDDAAITFRRELSGESVFDRFRADLGRLTSIVFREWDAGRLNEIDYAAYGLSIDRIHELITRLENHDLPMPGGATHV